MTKTLSKKKRLPIKTALTEMLNIDFPLIMAPMFLVTNTKMMIAAAESGIAGCIPALNFRTIEELEAGIKEIRSQTSGPIGINLIVNKSNIHAQKQLFKCLDLGVDFFITSLGSPEEVIKEARKQNIKVLCDVTEENYAQKVQDLGADGIIAVNSGAGGHRGNIPASVLVPRLKEKCHIPVISAGGVGDGRGVLSMLSLGADGLSVGSPFIATQECGVSEDYKNACVDYHAKDIVVTTKLSGTPCTVINTPYVKKIGTQQNFLENVLNQNKKLKKMAKMFTYYKGMKLLEKAAFSASYKTVWCAGSSIDFTEEVKSVQDIVHQYQEELLEAKQSLDRHFQPLS